MDTTAENYRLHEAAQQARLGDFLKSDNLASLETEIALARVCLESAKNSNNLLLVRDLLSVLGSLIKTHRAQLEKDGILLDKRTIGQLAEQMAEILSDEFGDYSDFPVRMNRAADRLCAAISGAHNEIGK